MYKELYIQKHLRESSGMFSQGNNLLDLLLHARARP